MAELRMRDYARSKGVKHRALNYRMKQEFPSKTKRHWSYDSCPFTEISEIDGKSIIILPQHVKHMDQLVKKWFGV